jgi:YVTN family beta-propeller protein
MLQRLFHFVIMIVLCVASVSVNSAPFAYVPNWSNKTISVIDTSSNAVTASIPLAHYPSDVAINPTATRVYVTTENDISVIDTSSNSVVSIDYSLDSHNQIAINPTGTRVYVSKNHKGGEYVSVIDAVSNTAISQISAFGQITDLAVNSAGTRLYVGEDYVDYHKILVFDTSNNEVIANIPLLSTGNGIAINPAGTRVYVTNPYIDTISVIDTSSNTVTATVAVGSLPVAVAVNPTGTRVYVANHTSNSVSVIDTRSNTVITTVPVPSGVGGVAINPAGTLVYVTGTRVSVINTSDNTIITTVPVSGNSSLPSNSYSNFIGPYLSSPQSGWWWNPNESGRGFTIEINGNSLYMAGYLYAANTGQAVWFVSGGSMSSSSTYQGTMTSYGYGQTLSGNYIAPRPTSTIGTISLNFTDATHAIITWPGGTIPIERFNIVENGVNTPRAPTQPETGWWWYPNENGRGFAIEIQNGMMFLAAYMYDFAGNPVWYAAYLSSNDPVWNVTQSRYQGTLVQYANGQSLMGAYHAPMVVNGNVGALQVQFQSTTTGTLTLPDGRIIPISRFRF